MEEEVVSVVILNRIIACAAVNRYVFAGVAVAGVFNEIVAFAAFDCDVVIAVFNSIVAFIACYLGVFAVAVKGIVAVAA